MSEFSVGFARVNITPPMGIPISGYYNIRLANKVLDELEVNALACCVGDSRAVILSVDAAGLFQQWSLPLRKEIAEHCGLPEEAVFIHCTHTHTGPEINLNRKIRPDIQQEYFTFFRSRLKDAAVFALEDLQPSRMSFAVGTAPHIAFIRRYRMKDGSIRTNPGINHPDIVSPIGEADERVGVLRFDRADHSVVVLASFGVHPDTIGGCNISADWPGFARRTVERVMPDTRCIILNGAEGDVNHVNSMPSPGDLNGMVKDFDDVPRGYDHARHMGWSVAGAVLQVVSKSACIPVNSLHAMQKIIQVPSNMPLPEELPMAREYIRLRREGRDAEIPYTGMMLTTVVAKADRMLQLEHGPESFSLYITALTLGSAALIGIPGEPFADIGRSIKKAPGWSIVLPCCCTNGGGDYFPSMEAYREGGYEAESSPFKPGVGEAITAAALDMLKAVKK